MAGEELFESLAHFVVVHNGQSPERAQRIADQAVAFLIATATATVPMVPRTTWTSGCTHSAPRSGETSQAASVGPYEHRGDLINTMLSPAPGDRPTIQEVRQALR